MADRSFWYKNHQIISAYTSRCIGLDMNWGTTSPFPVFFLSSRQILTENEYLFIFFSFIDGLLMGFVSGIQMETRRNQDRQR